MPLRIATWNMCRGNYLKKRAALAELAPDVAIIQEANGIAGLLPGDLWHGPNPRTGISVLTGDKHSVAVDAIDERAIWSIPPLKIRGQHDLNLLAVWTRLETGGYVKSLWDALDCYGDFLRHKPCIVMGDFNASAIWDKPRGKVDFSRLARRLETDFGLKSAYHSYFSESYGVETRATYHREWKVAKPFHIDYCFVPADWSIQEVRLGPYEHWRALSDHCPLVVDVEPPSMTP
jgi:hypothetical protein